MTEVPPEQHPITISDPQVMRALAHPARLAIMEHLSSTEAAVTATQCAEVAGLSPSATSYHLRALARFGLVEQAPSRGDARERLWQATMRSWQVEAGRSAGGEARAAEQTLVEVFLARDEARGRDWLRRAPNEPADWYEAAMYNDSLLQVTAEEMTALNRAVLDLMRPYLKRNRPAAETPAGSRTVALQYRAIPLD